ncbi:MAG: beta-galactosidase BgaS [Desulfurococcaceae archaeon]
MGKPMMEFPRGFKWGVSQSGFQFEMGDYYHRYIDTNTDWWHWVRDSYNISSRLVSGDLPEDGINYLELYKVDHENAAWLGLNSYRIGIEWSRVFPHPTWFIDVDVEYDGSGLVKDVRISKETLEELDKIANHDIVNLYREIILDLRKRGFKVVVNLLHFTLPYWLHNPVKARSTNLEKGPRGFIEDYFPIGFAKFAAYIAFKLGDLVDMWSTMNEPMVPIELGYMAPHSGFPPGVVKPEVLPKAFANVVLAHALAYKLIKKFDTVKADADSREPAEVGIIHNFIPAYPVDETSKTASEHYNYFHNTMLLEALVKGRLDTELDEKTIIVTSTLTGTLDWIGVNYYTRLVIRRRENAPFPVLDFEAVPGYGYACVPFSVSKAGRYCDGMGWEFFPEGLVDSLNIASKYSSTIYVTENGTSDHRDMIRAKSILSHAYAVYRALESGTSVQGYFHWSINDNYEWAHGFRQKFGLYEVNLITKERIPRPSAKVYREIVVSNCLKTEHLGNIVYEEKYQGRLL